jgi:hypothetical protein
MERNPARKASDKPYGSPELNGKKGDFCCFQRSGGWKTKDCLLTGLISQRPDLGQRKKATSFMLGRHLTNLEEARARWGMKKNIH